MFEEPSAASFGGMQVVKLGRRSECRLECFEKITKVDGRIPGEIQRVQNS